MGSAHVHPKQERSAICLLSSETVNGTVLFHQSTEYDLVRVRFYLQGPPNETHAIHIHEFGDTRHGCDSLGPHFNPFHKTHGSLLYNMPRHVGDLINNITFNQYGRFIYEYNDELISLFTEDSIYGRSIVIHEGEDDLGLGKGSKREESLKTGNAGKRICCGIIACCSSDHGFSKNKFGAQLVKNDAAGENAPLMRKNTWYGSNQ